MIRDTTATKMTKNTTHTKSAYLYNEKVVKKGSVMFVQ